VAVDEIISGKCMEWKVKKAHGRSLTTSKIILCK
jgi:hypothetical protein